MSKAHGKGTGISINEPNQDFTSLINRYKAEFSPVPPPRHEFAPLKSFPVAPDPRKADREFYASLPSWHA